MTWQIVEHNGKPIRIALHRDKNGTWVSHQGVVSFIPTQSATTKTQKAQDSIAAPMTGKIVSIEVAEGDVVEEGMVLIVMEAMKMEYRLKAPKSGTIKAIHCQANELVDLGKNLVSLK